MVTHQGLGNGFLVDGDFGGAILGSVYQALDGGVEFITAVKD